MYGGQRQHFSGFSRNGTLPRRLPVLRNHASALSVSSRLKASSRAALVALVLAVAGSLLYVVPIGQDGSPLIPLTGAWRLAKLVTPVFLAAAALVATSKPWGLWAIAGATAGMFAVVVRLGLTWHFPAAVALLVCGALSLRSPISRDGG